jgi:hypothetical protein
VCAFDNIAFQFRTSFNDIFYKGELSGFYGEKSAKIRQELVELLSVNDSIRVTPMPHNNIDRRTMIHLFSTQGINSKLLKALQHATNEIIINLIRQKLSEIHNRDHLHYSDRVIAVLAVKAAHMSNLSAEIDKYKFILQITFGISSTF